MTVEASIDRFGEFMPEFESREVYSSDRLSGIFVGHNCPFEDVRKLQDQCVRQRVSGALEQDLLLFCEHAPTLSMGWRATESDLYLELHEYAERGIEVVRADRGGQTTYHGPGQLVLYPVVHLRQNGLGIKRFVTLVLEAIVDCLGEMEIEAMASLHPSGIWVPTEKTGALRAGTDSAAKIGSLGLRVVRGVTNHGFSLNVTMDEEPYALFTACGVPQTAFTCISNEFGGVVPPLEAMSAKLAKLIANRLSRGYLQTP